MEVGLKCNVISNEMGKHCFYARYNVVEVEHFKRQNLLATKGQKLARK